MRIDAGAAAVTVLAALAGAAIGSVGGADAEVDRRSHEQLRCVCSGGDLESGVSLFANGTVRIRDTGGSSPGLLLVELDPGELEAFQNRIAEIDLAEVESRLRGPSSETLEQCLLRLELKSGDVAEYRFPRMAALPLALGRVLAVVDDLIALVEERSRSMSGLPSAYEPRVGDVLVKRDGSRYRVVRVTADGGGVEIIGLESPLVAYLSFDGVRAEFSGIESRRHPVAGREP